MLNRRQKMTSIAHYSENTVSMDSTILHRHRHDVTSMINIAPLGLIALVVCYYATVTHITSNFVLGAEPFINCLY
jgi:hypothetical protein